MKKHRTIDSMLLKWCFVIMSIVAFSSCDCLQKVEGKVYDAQSMQVLQEVIIYKLNQPYHTIKTDSKGEFKFSDVDGGRSCSEVVLIFEKVGYQTDTITFSANSIGVEVKLKK